PPARKTPLVNQLFGRAFGCAPAAPGAQCGMPEDNHPSPLAPYLLGVIMERTLIPDRWGSEKWEAKGVVCDNRPVGAAHEVIFRDARTTQYLFPGFELKLRRDEADGYYLNITAPLPKIFVLWRKDDDELASPRLLTVSFNEGARWMDGGESVD